MSPELLVIGGAFVTGLMGGGHCALMCGGIATGYAHMSRIDVAEGDEVAAGDVVGAVGSTGRSTGPHLHYEVRVNNRAVNPTRIQSAGGKQLAGKELGKFKQLKQRVFAMMQQAPSATQVAQIKQ